MNADEVVRALRCFSKCDTKKGMVAEGAIRAEEDAE